MGNVRGRAEKIKAYIRDYMPEANFFLRLSVFLDVALGKDGRVIIIEGNSAADPDVTQMPDQVGKWPLYKQELRKIAGLHSKKTKLQKRRESFDKTKPAILKEGNTTIA